MRTLSIIVICCLVTSLSIAGHLQFFRIGGSHKNDTIKPAYLPDKHPASSDFYKTQLCDSGAARQDSAATPDSILVFDLVKDNPIASMIDSLVQLKYFEKTNFTTDTNALNKYRFPKDSIPNYPDADYSKRLAKLDALTPFDLVYNPVVRQFIELYVIKKRELTSRMMGLAQLYFPMFEEILDRYNMPLELKYLAMVESALNPFAKSRAGAMGLWQFMYRTGKVYDLDVSTYIDERRDPVQETVAACEHLRDLFDYYGNWELALAAYNAGAGNVNKAIRRSKGKMNFWEIWPWLPRETRGYVPAFIAVNYMMNYSAEHNLYPVAPKFLNWQVDTVHINYELSLEQVSTVLGIPMEDLQYLNPIFKTPIIPYAGEEQILHLPADKIGAFINNEQTIFAFKPVKVDSIKADTLPLISTIHIVRQGEMLSAIANKYNCTIDQIRSWNNLNSNVIHPGQQLTLFTKNAAAKADTTLVASSETKKPPETIISKPVAQPAPKPVKPDNHKYIYHTIQPGDTLWDIANLYDGVTVQQIKRLNNITNVKKLKPGMKIKVAVAI